MAMLNNQMVTWVHLTRFGVNATNIKREWFRESQSHSWLSWDHGFISIPPVPAPAEPDLLQGGKAFEGRAKPALEAHRRWGFEDLPPGFFVGFLPCIIRAWHDLTAT